MPEIITRITIGGDVYDIPEMNFAAVEMAWPYVEEAIMNQNPMDGPRACLGIIACTLIEQEDWDIMNDQWKGLRASHLKREGSELTEKSTYRVQFDSLLLWFKRKLKANEIAQCQVALDSILIDAGLIARKEDVPEGKEEPGEAKEESGSMETAPLTSQSSSPQELKEAVGS